MRILLLANSYPSVAAPSGAPYMTARLRELTSPTGRHEAAEVTALALRPIYSPAARAVRATARASSQRSLALAPQPTDASWRWREAPVRWGVLDLVRARDGHRPERAIERAVAAVTARIEDTNVDIVHAHGMYALPAGEVGARVAGHLGVPLVVTMHGSDVTEAMAATPEAAARTLGGAGATIYVSEALRRRALELGAPKEHSHVIPNGVDTQIFTSDEPGRGDEEESARGSARRGPRLLFVGNLLGVKGADRLPAIVEAVAARHPGTHLVVAGDGPYRAPVAARLAGRVTMLGRVGQSEVARQMRAADVLLVPSRSEGWGCVVSESYAAGTPVVASAVGGLRESVLDPDHLVEAADEAAGPPRRGAGAAEAEARFAGLFADRVCEVLEAPPSAKAMRERVAGQSWPEVVGRELAVLRGVLGARR